MSIYTLINRLGSVYMVIIVGWLCYCKHKGNWEVSIFLVLEILYAFG